MSDEAILDKLYKQPLFDPLDGEALAEIAPRFHVKSYPADAPVFRQGEEAHHFYLITEGEFEVLQEEGGEDRRINLLYAGEFFGDVALLYDEPRGATVRAVDDSEVLYLTKQDFLALLEEFPVLEARLDQMGRAIEERIFHSFPGQHPQEIVIYYRRRHWTALVRRLVRVGLVFLLLFIAMALAVVLFGESPATQARIAWISLAFSTLPILWGAWEVADWLNDYYIVTNERVIHIEKVIGFREERFEAPLNKIQNVNVLQATPMSELLNYGNLIIATASQGGSGANLDLDHVPEANLIAERLIQELTKERNVLQQQGRQEKRRALRAAIGMEPSTETPVGEADEPVAPLPPAQSPLVVRVLRGVLRYFWPFTREVKGDQIIWRKHWILLLRNSLVAWLLFFALVGVILVELLALDATLLPVQLTIWVWLGFLVADVLWLAWLYADWRNDLYILTPEAILDQEQNPLGFNKEVRRAPLDTIQDFRYVQRNPIMVLFGVGNVLIQTAGQEGSFTFDWVKNPRDVQHDIFQAIQARQAQRERNEAAAINQELLELLRLYDEAMDEKRGRRPDGAERPVPPPEPGPPGDPDAPTRRHPT